MGRKVIVLSCDYEVYPLEWDEIHSQVRELLNGYRLGYYVNIEVAVHDEDDVTITR